MNPRLIDLNDNVFGCVHIKWKEVLWLPQYRMYAHPPNDEVLNNLISVCKLFDKVRHILGGHPMQITSGYRPELYNEFIGGAKYSAHMDGMALDFQHSKLQADECRSRLISHMVPLNFRMEDKKGSSWVHIDIRKPLQKRFFKP
jgi:hypothetical protein